jgi:aminoglycoside 6'-N-acetyltransferase
MADVQLRPLETGDSEALRALHLQPGVTRWWGPMEEDFPHDEPESTRLTIVAGGEIAGMIQYAEELEPECRHASLDIFVGDDFAGSGIGTEAIQQVVRTLVEERGHHRITIDPETDNAAAIRSYEKAGFRRVGVMEAAWLNRSSGEWRDVLLMELVRPPDQRAVTGAASRPGR